MYSKRNKTKDTSTGAKQNVVNTISHEMRSHRQDKHKA